jgi:cell division protein FtsZ
MVNITGGADLSLTRVNELMTAVTEEFGKEAHVIMGAVIDEELQGRVEVCVLGTTDLGSRNFVRRPPAPAKKTEKSNPPMPAAENGRPEKAPAAAAAGPRLPAAATAAGPNPADKPKQDEFGFGGSEPVENRGSFNQSDRNLFQGQDLDVPTYLRKGIKIPG